MWLLIILAEIKISTVGVKQIPPYGFLKIFPKRLGIFNHFLHTYYAIISTLDYKFLFKHLQLRQSYAILANFYISLEL